jgi:hypothetical protein
MQIDAIRNIASIHLKIFSGIIELNVVSLWSLGFEHCMFFKMMSDNVDALKWFGKICRYDNVL